MNIPGDPSKRSAYPIVNGASVLAVKYADGVMMMSDTLGSYGSLARYKNLERIRKVNDNCIIAGDGEYSDFQHINNWLEELVIDDYNEDDGVSMSAKQVHCVLSRVLYNRRSKMDPLWNSLVVGGNSPDGPFLGLVDLYGSSYTENMIATGYGAYMALPIMRKKWRENMTEAEAKALLEECMTVLFYRHCTTINKFQIATITKTDINITDPYSLKTQWEYKRFVDPHAVNC